MEIQGSRCYNLYIWKSVNFCTFIKKGDEIMNMKTILAAALTAGFFVQPCMTALASVSAPESDKNQIGPGFEAPAEENAESAFTPWTKVDGVYVDDTGKAIDGAVLRGVSVSTWQGDVDWGKAAADDISFALVRMASIGYEG